MSCRSSLSFTRSPPPSMARPGPHGPAAGAKLGRWRTSPLAGPTSRVSATPELVDFLLSLGATPEQIAEAATRSRLIGLGADLVFSPAEGFTARELAARAGAGRGGHGHLAGSRGGGAGAGRPDVLRDDVGLVRTLTSVDLFTAAEGDELMHVVGSALSKVADAAIAFYVQTRRVRAGRQRGRRPAAGPEGRRRGPDGPRPGGGAGGGLHPSPARRRRPSTAGPGPRERPGPVPGGGGIRRPGGFHAAVASDGHPGI